MRFESVTAHAFGPFRGEILTLAPGMNVVYGQNETGKSTWHAAIYAGLCGMRRGRGQPRLEDRAFALRHRPWDRDDAWEVGAIVVLADDRRVELRHDLAGLVDSSARDAEIAGRDYSNEIMNEGAPDGSRWLGLDRRAFLNTACVRQADILGLLEPDRAKDLQDELERAAATAGTDATAAEALQHLERYRTEQVGTERSRTRPMQTSRERVRAARRELEEAQEASGRYLERAGRVDRLEQELRLHELETDAALAVLAETTASRAEDRLTRARELSAHFAGEPQRRPSEEGRLVQDIEAALTTWRSHPEPSVPSGPTIAELERELDEIDQKAGRAAGDTQDEHAAGQHSALRLLLASAGLVGGSALALAGLFVPAAILIALALPLFVWWALSRRAAPTELDSGASALLAQRMRHVEHLIDDRRAAEQVYGEASRGHEEAEELLRQAVRAAELQADSPEARVEALVAWQSGRVEALERADREQSDWDALQQLLAEQSLAEIAADAARLLADAERLAARVDADALTASRESSVTDEQLEDRRQQDKNAREEWNTSRGELAQFAQDLPSVVDAEDELAIAERELARIQELDQTLATTIETLRRAEERVHRNIAPMLSQTVVEWLPRVTGGRYTDCLVDPESLAVEVRSAQGALRPASLLSRGAAEQVYLLLRVALARHLTRSDEVCPLILDEAVSACDAQRKREVLETLLVISESVQVIIFSHEETVRRWAEERLEGPRHRLTSLDSDVVPA